MSETNAMQETNETSETTYWEYKFWWRGIPCEAKNGNIFVNGRVVEEFPNVNRSAQTEERFFIEDQDVTDVILRYFGEHASTKPTPALEMASEPAEEPVKKRSALKLDFLKKKKK